MFRPLPPSGSVHVSRSLIASAIASFALVGGALAYVHREPVVACEDLIKARILSPGSYERVSVNRPYAPSGTVEVEITFDAENAFGTPLREEWSCTYHSAAFRADTSYPVKIGPTAAQVLRNMRGGPITPTPVP